MGTPSAAGRGGAGGAGSVRNEASAVFCAPSSLVPRTSGPPPQELEMDLGTAAAASPLAPPSPVPAASAPQQTQTFFVAADCGAAAPPPRVAPSPIASRAGPSSSPALSQQQPPAFVASSPADLPSYPLDALAPPSPAEARQLHPQARPMILQRSLAPTAAVAQLAPRESLLEVAEALNAPPPPLAGAACWKAAPSPHAQRASREELEGVEASAVSGTAAAPGVFASPSTAQGTQRVPEAVAELPPKAAASPMQEVPSQQTQPTHLQGGVAPQEGSGNTAAGGDETPEPTLCGKLSGESFTNSFEDILEQVSKVLSTNNNQPSPGGAVAASQVVGRGSSADLGGVDEFAAGGAAAATTQISINGGVWLSSKEPQPAATLHHAAPAPTAASPLVPSPIQLLEVARARSPAAEDKANVCYGLQQQTSEFGCCPVCRRQSPLGGRGSGEGRSWVSGSGVSVDCAEAVVVESAGISGGRGASPVPEAAWPAAMPRAAQSVHHPASKGAPSPTFQHLQSPQSPHSPLSVPHPHAHSHGPHSHSPVVPPPQALPLPIPLSPGLPSAAASSSAACSFRDSAAALEESPYSDTLRRMREELAAAQCENLALWKRLEQQQQNMIQQQMLHARAASRNSSRSPLFAPVPGATCGGTGEFADVGRLSPRMPGAAAAALSGGGLSAASPHGGEARGVGSCYAGAAASGVEPQLPDQVQSAPNPSTPVLRNKAEAISVEKFLWTFPFESRDNQQCRLKFCADHNLVVKLLGFQGKRVELLEKQHRCRIQTSQQSASFPGYPNGRCVLFEGTLPAILRATSDLFAVVDTSRPGLRSNVEGFRVCLIVPMEYVGRLLRCNCAGLHALQEGNGARHVHIALGNLSVNIGGGYSERILLIDGPIPNVARVLETVATQLQEFLRRNSLSGSTLTQGTLMDRYEFLHYPKRIEVNLAEASIQQ